MVGNGNENGDGTEGVSSLLNKKTDQTTTETSEFVPRECCGF